MTIREAAESLHMDLPEFYSLFKITGDVPAQTQMKNIGQFVPGYSLDEVKNILQ